MPKYVLPYNYSHSESQKKSRATFQNAVHVAVFNSRLINNTFADQNTSVDENEQELILKFSLMKLTQNVDDQPEILDDSELQIENECANYETKPDKKPSKKTISKN